MPGIFISYRRNESAGHAGRLFDRLTARFGEDRVFMDVDTLDPSDHFATRIEKAIATADVMLVLIGPTWVAQTDRLASPDDFIRREILAALRVDCRLVPVCLDGAAMPDAAAAAGGPAAAAARAKAPCCGTASSSATPTTSPTRWRPSCVPRPRPRGAACRWRSSRAGWPLSWWAGLVRRTSPRAAVAIAAVPIALALGAHRWPAPGGGASGAKATTSRSSR